MSTPPWPTPATGCWPPRSPPGGGCASPPATGRPRSTRPGPSCWTRSPRPARPCRRPCSAWAGRCEVRLVLPNKHHFVVDMDAFGIANENEVYYAADRPYGLIEGAVLADD